MNNIAQRVTSETYHDKLSLVIKNGNIYNTKKKHVVKMALKSILISLALYIISVNGYATTLTFPITDTAACKNTCANLVNNQSVIKYGVGGGGLMMCIPSKNIQDLGASAVSNACSNACNNGNNLDDFTKSFKKNIMQKVGCVSTSNLSNWKSIFSN